MRKDILQQLFDGGISVEHEIPGNTSEYQILKRVSTEKLDGLRKTLSPEQFTLVEDYCNSTAAYERLEQQDAFQRGVQFAARFLMEALT